jgi:hypothetical protein
MTYKYYIPEININRISYINVNKLKNNNHHSNICENILLGEDGFYKYHNKNLYKHIISSSQITHIDNYLNQYTLICSQDNWYKIKYNIPNIPFNHSYLNIDKHIFKISPKSNTNLIIEYIDNYIHDIYFLSPETHDNLSFQEDISYFSNMLI